MSDVVSHDDVLDKLTYAELFEDGPEKVAAVEEAVRLADALNDLDLRYESREALIDACTFGGFPEKALVAFAWCQTHFDKEPERFEEWDLLWRHKWIIDKLANFPQFSKSQIYEMLEDMTKRYKAWGAGDRPELKLRCALAYSMGDKVESRRLMLDWQKTHRDELTDCEACEADFQVELYNFFGEHENAVKAGEIVLKTPLTCAHVPHTTYAKMLRPLFFLGLYDEARKYHRKGYPMIKNNPAFLPGVGSTLEFLVLTDNLGKASKVLEAHLAWATNSKDMWMRFQFFLTALLLFNTLMERGKDTIKLTLPQSCPYFETGGIYELQSLRDRMKKEAETIAKSFDKRNENTYFMDLMKEHAAYQTQIVPVPLKATAAAAK